MSRLRSATSRFRFRFSSLSCFSRANSLELTPPYFFRHAYTVFALNPYFRASSATGTPASACFTAYTISLSLNFDFLILVLLVQKANLTLRLGPVFRGRSLPAVG